MTFTAMTLMTQQTRISSRIDAELKKQGDSILAELGIKPSQAITLFYKQIVRQRGLPFAARIPNDETIKVLNEDLSKQKRFSSIEELMGDLH